MTKPEAERGRGLVAARRAAKQAFKAWTESDGPERRAELLLAANQTNSNFQAFFEKYGDELVTLAIRALGGSTTAAKPLDRCACGHDRVVHMRGAVTGCRGCDCQSFQAVTRGASA